MPRTPHSTPSGGQGNLNQIEPSTLAAATPRQRQRVTPLRFRRSRKSEEISPSLSLYLVGYPSRVWRIAAKLQWRTGRRAGLCSRDRNNKATLPLTQPGRTSKSSAKDSSLLIAKFQARARRPPFLVTDRCTTAEVRGRSLFVHCYDSRISSLSGMDSDLEAFSRNPADGSFAALPCRTAAKTNYLKPRFLSY
jgi:hypothetical protein